MTAEFLENDLKRPHTLVLTLLESLGKKERNVGVGGEAQLLSRISYEKLSRLPLTYFHFATIGICFPTARTLPETIRLVRNSSAAPFFTSTQGPR